MTPYYLRRSRSLLRRNQKTLRLVLFAASFFVLIVWVLRSASMAH